MTTYLTLLFLVALSAAVSTSFAAFVSINCGSSEPYFDVQDSVNWTGDGDYVHNGVSQLVNSFYGAGPILSTLRVFPTLQKNCYTINNLQNGERVLVRASFYYGNYDGKHSPPEFDLLIDGSHLRTMSLQKYADNAYLITEIIYVVNGNATSFCLARTLPNQLPFINALELRSLGPKMYNRAGSKSFLLLRNRVAQGANQTIRYSYAIRLTKYYEILLVINIKIKRKMHDPLIGVPMIRTIDFGFPMYLMISRHIWRSSRTKQLPLM